MAVSGTAGGLVELTRPVNALAASVLTFIGAYVAGGLTTAPAAVAAAVLATGLAVGAGNAINDYFDRDIDRINQPDRPIPRVDVVPKQALWFSVGLFAVAVGLALSLPLIAIAIAAVNLLALVFYTEYFKGLPGFGNALVAYLVGSTFLFGGAAVENVGPTVVLFVLAAVATLTREIVKDVEDVDGDREEGLNTLPIAIGERRALLVAAVVLVVGVVASPLPYFRDDFGVLYLLVVLPAVVMMVYGARVSFSDPSVGQRYLKYGMFLATVAFILGRIGADVSIGV